MLENTANQKRFKLTLGYVYHSYFTSFQSDNSTLKIIGKIDQIWYLKVISFIIFKYKYLKNKSDG